MPARDATGRPARPGWPGWLVQQCTQWASPDAESAGRYESDTMLWVASRSLWLRVLRICWRASNNKKKNVDHCITNKTCLQMCRLFLDAIPLTSLVCIRFRWVPITRWLFACCAVKRAYEAVLVCLRVNACVCTVENLPARSHWPRERNNNNKNKTISQPAIRSCSAPRCSPICHCAPFLRSVDFDKIFNLENTIWEPKIPVITNHTTRKLHLYLTTIFFYYCNE